MLIDSHCHLDYLEHRGEDVAAVLARAQDRGVALFLSVATTLVGEAKLRGYCTQFPEVFRSVGVHPNHATETPALSAAQLILLADQPKVVALGECGFDHFHQRSDAQVQEKVFRAHIEAAQDTGLPLIIHTREADADTIATLHTAYRQKPFRGVFHCYTGSEAILEAANEINFYISLTGILTYGKSEELRAQAVRIPKERLMLETDAPFLAPKPHRGKQCEPFMVRDTANLLGELLELDAEQLEQQTSENFFRLFTHAAPTTVS